MAVLYPKALDHPKGTSSPKDGLLKRSFSVLRGWFIKRPRYMDVYIPHTSRKVIGQLRVSSHQLETKTGQVLCIPIAKSSWKLCERGIEHEDLFCVGSELKAHKKEICHSLCQLHHHLKIMERLTHDTLAKTYSNFKSIENQPLY